MPPRVNFTFGKSTFKVHPHSKVYDLFRKLKKEFPDLKISHKRDCWWHWVAHVIICILTVGLNRRYIRDFTTTGKNRIDLSDAHWKRLQDGNHLQQDRVWECIMHEREHLRQFRDKGTFVMVVIWLFPPVLFCYGRAVIIEKPGYLMSLRCKFQNSRSYAESKEYRDWWVGQFTGPNYGWAWIISSQVERWFDNELKRLQQEADNGST